MVLTVAVILSPPAYAAMTHTGVYASNPFLTGEALYVSDSGVSGYTRGANREKWRTTLDTRTFEPVVANDAVVVGSASGLYCLDRETGAQRWHFRSETPVFSPTILAGRVYAGAEDGVLRAIALGDGSLVWSRGFSGWVYPPVIHREFLVVAASDGSLSGVHAHTGAIVWSAALPQEPVYRPVAGPDGIVLVTTFSGHLIAVKATTGFTAWRTRDPTAGFPPLIVDGYLYMGTFGGMLRVRDLKDGSLVWEQAFPGKLPFTPFVADDLVLVGDEHGRVTAVDRRSGNPLWQKTIPQTPVSGPILVDGKIVVPTKGGFLSVVGL